MEEQGGAAVVTALVKSVGAFALRHGGQSHVVDSASSDSVEHQDIYYEVRMRENLDAKQSNVHELEEDLNVAQLRLDSARSQVAKVHRRMKTTASELEMQTIGGTINGQLPITPSDEAMLAESFSSAILQVLGTCLEGTTGPVAEVDRHTPLKTTTTHSTVTVVWCPPEVPHAATHYGAGRKPKQESLRRATCTCSTLTAVLCTRPHARHPCTTSTAASVTTRGAATS